MKALGKDIWDFYLNGWPEDYTHDLYDREVAYWPGWNSSEGAYSLLEDDKEYDLKEFGILRHDDDNSEISFEDAYIKWKGIEKPEPLTFDRWFAQLYPKTWTDESPMYRSFSYSDLEKCWNAAISSVKGEN